MSLLGIDQLMAGHTGVEQTADMVELRLLAVQLAEMMQDVQPGLCTWRLMLSNTIMRMAGFAGMGDVVGKLKDRDELLAALKGVVAVADRKTDEFNRARAAIAEAEARA